MKGASDASTGTVDGKKVMILKDPNQVEKDINMEAIHFSCQSDKVTIHPITVGLSSMAWVLMRV